MADLERLIQAIDAAEQSAYGSDTDSDLQRDRAYAIQYYHGQNVEPAPEGRSQISDRTVFETIQWIIPSLSRIFANGDDIVEFQPFGPEDEEAAKQESDYLNYLVTQKNPWPVIFNTWAMDALLLKNGYCEPYMEERILTEVETYERQSDEALAFLLQDDGVEVIAHESVPDEKAQPEPMVDPMTGQPVVDPATGQPVMQPPRMLHTVTIRKNKPRKKLCFKVIPPERTKIDIDTETFSLEHSNYFEYWEIVTISHLRALGFDVPDDVGTGDEDWDDTDEADARNLYGEETIDGGSEHIDPSMRKVRVRCIFIRHDTDEDGIAELQRVYRVGSRILDRNGKPAIYPATRVGVACITPMLNPHRHVGTSEADITVDIQRTRTFILRAGLDGLALSLNPRHVVSNEVNLDDLMVSRPGGIVRMLNESSAVPGEGHVFAIATQNTFPDAITGLEYMGQVHESRTGVSRAFSGVDPSTLNNGNSSGVAINQLSTMASQRVEQIARMFSVGIEYLFSLAHELVIKSGHQSEVVKLRNKWTPIDPSTWRTGRDMRIVVGYGAGNKDALVSRLAMIRMSQLEALQLGLPNVTPSNIYATDIEIAKAADFSAPQRFWTDPSTVQPPPPQPDPGLIKTQMTTQSAEKIKAAELESQERIKQAELLQKDQAEQLRAELALLLERMKLGGGVDIERVRQSGAAQLEREKQSGLMQMEHVKGSIKNEPENKKNEKLDGIAQLIAELRQAQKQIGDSLNAPREIIRGADGRVAGVKVGGVERKVKRDADGKVAGLK